MELSPAAAEWFYRPALCAGCSWLLIGVPMEARFCPGCGTELPTAPVAAPAQFSEMARPLILAGYASALFRLGWRYETGAGSTRNSSEALRCYYKAAKLGDGDARARLIRRRPLLPPAADIRET